MPDFVVSNIFKGTDKISPVLKKMGQEGRTFHKIMNRSFKGASDSALSFKKIVGGILTAGIIQRGFGLMQEGVRGVASEFVDFDAALTQAAAKFPEKIKRGTKEFNELGKVARRVGAETQFSAADAASGLDFLAMAGFNAQQSIALLPSVTDLATVANTDLARATDIASDALGSFGLMTQDTAQLTQNLARVNDVFAKTVSSANTNIEDLFEAVKEAGPVAVTAGASIETASVMIGQLANAGLKGTRAGTILKNMFIRLSAPVPKAEKLLKKLGVSVVDSSGNMRDMFDILQDLNKSTKNMGTAQKSATLDVLFGKRAVAGASVLLGLGADALRDYREQLEAAGGASQDMAKDIRQSIMNRLLELRSAAIETGFKFIDAFANKIPGGINTAIEAVRKFDVKPIIDGVLKAIQFFKEMISTIQSLIPLFKTLVAIFIGYKSAVIALLALNFIATFLKWAKAIKTVAAAQGLLNAVMLANPILLVATAIGVLIGMIALLIVHWDDVKAATGRVINFLGKKIQEFVDWIGELAKKFAKFTTGVINNVSEFFGLGKIVPELEFAPTVKEPEIGVDPITQEVFVDMKGATLTAAQERMLGKQVEAMTEAGSKKVKTMSTAERPEEPERQAPQRKPPNLEQLQLQAQQLMQFEGKLEIAGAPEGSKFTQEKKRGAPPLKVEMLGANP